MRFGAEDDCAEIAADLRRSVQGKPANGNIRLLHNLDKSISSQLLQIVEGLGGAMRPIAAAPFGDQGAAIDGLSPARASGWTISISIHTLKGTGAGGNSRLQLALRLSQQKVIRIC